MAIFGDLGRALGLGSAGDVSRDVASALGITNPVTLDAIQKSGDKASSFISNVGERSGPPAGVDSPATVLNVSQTSSLGGPTGDGPGLLGGGRNARMNQAFLGGPLFGQLVGQAGRLLSKPGVGGLIGGVGAGVAADFVMDMFGNQKKLVITRKLQRDVKKVFMLSGGDIGFISMNSLMLFGKDLSEDQILRILFKTFKNQGPYVTKAAVRKTRATIRKMETLCDLKDRLCPPKRRAPARRRTMSAQTITQVK